MCALFFFQICASTRAEKKGVPTFIRTTRLFLSCSYVHRLSSWHPCNAHETMQPSVSGPVFVESKHSSSCSREAEQKKKKRSFQIHICIFTYYVGYINHATPQVSFFSPYTTRTRGAARPWVGAVCTAVDLVVFRRGECEKQAHRRSSLFKREMNEIVSSVGTDRWF